MTLLLIVKLLIVVIFLVLFLRRPSVVWGIGLLTVTTAVLLDTFLGTFNREQMLAEMGFFFYVIGGALVGGMAVWAWGVLRPLLKPAQAAVPATAPTPTPTTPDPKTVTFQPIKDEKTGTAFDRQMLYNEIRTRLGREDVLDLLFDLRIQENEVMTLHQDMNQLIIRLMDEAAQRGQTGELALAVERILTPPPPQNLPRREKIDSSSPPTILRHYLLAHYSLTDLKQMATRLEIDWEQLDHSNKRTFTRTLLQYLYRRNGVDRLIGLIHGETAVSDEAE